jgi:hypothetical protein
MHVSQQRLQISIVEVELRHAFFEAAGAHEGGDLGIAMGVDVTEEGRGTVGAVGVAAVADGAVRGKGFGGRLLSK